MTSDRGEPARPEPADAAGDESLADAFGAVARQLRERSAETLAPWDITPAHLRALQTLRRTRAVARAFARSNGSAPPSGTTESGTTRATRSGWAIE